MLEAVSDLTNNADKRQDIAVANQKLHTEKDDNNSEQRQKTKACN